MKEGAPVRRGSRRGWITTLYLYVLSLVGVVLVTIGGVRLLDMGMKALVFTAAEQEERISMRQPPMPYTLDRVERLAEGDTANLAAHERATLRQWLEEYRQWKERSDSFDPIVSRRQRTASSSLAMILVGLPLYLYHWHLIRRESGARSRATEKARGVSDGIPDRASKG